MSYIYCASTIRIQNIVYSPVKSISQCTTNVLLYRTMRWVHNEDMLQSIFMIYLLSRLTEGFGTIFSFEKWGFT